MCDSIYIRNAHIFADSICTYILYIQPEPPYMVDLNRFRYAGWQVQIT